MILRPFKGHFITLEGGEGSGKSSLLLELERWLTSAGRQVVVTREPGGSSLGETLRHWLLEQNGHQTGDLAELLLFLAARAQHIQEKILPSLEKGYVVLCDRFNDSTIAYQGGARHLGIEYVTQLCSLVCGKIQPQLTLFLDVSPEIGLARSQALTKDQAGAGELDRIEAAGLAFHQKIRLVFNQLLEKEPSRIMKIDANLPKETVKKQALELLNIYFKST